MKDIEKAKQIIWRRAQKEQGIHVSKKLREYFDREVVGEIDYTEDIEEGNYECLLEQYLEFLKIGLETSYFPPLKETIKKEPHDAHHNTYQRPLNRRLYLVDFVIGKQLTAKNKREHSFTEHERINWTEICAAWNQVHPHDAMTKEVLKATFYRATRDPVLREKYFTRKALEHLDRIDDLLLALVKRLRKEPRHVSSKGISNIGEEIVNIVEKMTEELETLKDDSTIGVENRELFIARMNKIDENLTDIANSLRRSEQKGESHERTHKEKKK